MDWLLCLGLNDSGGATESEDIDDFKRLEAWPNLARLGRINFKF